MRKLFAFFILTVFIFVCVCQIFQRTVYAADITSTTNIISDVHITNTDGTALGTNIAKDAQIRLTYDFAIPNRSDVAAGDTYTFSIPQQILIQYAVPFTIKDTASGTLIGNGLLDTSGNITITFADYPAEYSNVHGSFWFDLQFNKTKIGNTNPQNIIFGLGGTSQPVTIQITFDQPPPPVASIVKSGSLTAANEITWTMTVDQENVTISEAQIVDAIPSGQSFVAGSVTVGGSAADSANYSYDGGTSTFTYNFPADVASQQVITFKTKIADSEFTKSKQGSTLHEGNKATLNHDGTSVVSNTATVNVPVNFISKTGWYDAADKKINWTITFNQVSIIIPDAVVTDTLPSGLTLDGSSVKVDGVSSSSYTYSSPKITFTIGAIAESHVIQFSTDVDSNFYLGNDWKVYTNSATLTGQNIPANTTDSTGVGVYSDVVNKQGSSYDRKTGQITWKIIVDSNTVQINNAVVTDAINAGQAFINGSVTINGSPANGSNYTYNSGTSTLIYNFPASINTQQTITFKTQVTDPAIYASNVSTTYYNTAVLTGSNIPSSSSQGNQNVLSQVIDKAGTGYDYQTRQVSWKITVNANQMALSSVVITDNIPAGQQFLAGSESIDGGADAGGFSYLDADQGDSSKSGTLTYTFASAINQTYHITFKTTVTDLTIFNTNGDQTIQNSATIKDDLVPGGVTDNGSQIVHNTVIGKSASYTSGNQYIDWSLTINTNDITLSKNEITDQFQAGLALDTSSIKLYHQTVNANGSLTIGAEIPLPANGNYVKYDLSTSTLHFVIPDPVSGSYLLTYRTDVTDKSKSPFTNTASFSGTGSTQTGTSQAVTVAWASSGSSGQGEVGSMDITKVDSNDSSKKLQGAVFQLIDKYGNVVQQQTSDAAGSALFSRLRFDVDYTVKEITPPTGYLMTGDPYTFQISGAADDPKDLFYAYTDDQILGNIQFTKTDGTNPLAGAVFTLYDAGNNAIATATSGTDGKVLFQNVPYGSYTIKETTPPAGYFASSDVLTATITQNGATVVPNKTTVVDVPYLGNIQLTKLSTDGKTTLAGAVFTLYSQSDTSYTNPIATATTDSSGLAEFKNIPYGNYAIKETTPPTGYFVSDTVLTASITQDKQTVTADPATVSDQVFLGKIQVTKVSSVDQSPLAGCTFSLFSQNDAGFSTPLATAVSGADGVAEFDKVPYGSYTIKETTPPTGYFISSNVVTASITKDGETVTANPQSISDEPYRGNIQLTKLSTDGKTTLAGAVFTLYSQSDTSYTNPITTATTDSNGLAEFQNVPYGDYAIKETTPPAGYFASDKILTASITQDKQTVTTDPASVSDQVYLGKVRVTKISSFSQNPLAGCTFSLFSQNDTSFSTPLATAVSGDDGIAEFENVPYGNYTVKETNPPTGYFISDKVLSASITKDGQTITANPESIADPPYRGIIELVKTASNGKTLLSGAVFTLYNASDTAFSTPIAMATSGSNGLVQFHDIPYGSYTIKETKAPTGYRLNHTILQAQITQNGQTLDLGSLADTPADVKSPATGDNILDYVLVLAVCIAAGSSLLAFRKKRYRARH